MSTLRPAWLLSLFVCVGCESVGTIGNDAIADTSTTDTESAPGTDDGSSSSEGAHKNDVATDTTTSGPTGGGTTTDDGGDEMPMFDLGGAGDVGGGALPPCCSPADGPGCEDADVQTCVCDLDPYCCENAWDEACVNTAMLSGCSGCGGRPLLPVDCCMASMETGCADQTVQDCVCAMDEYCCWQQWDDTCVAEIAEFGCGMCG